MKKTVLLGLLLSLFLVQFSTAQETIQAIEWKAVSKKTANNKYQLVFSAENKNNWEIYSPDANFDGIPSGGLVLPDSSIITVQALKAATKGETVKSLLFEGQSFEVFKKNIDFVAEIEFPADLLARSNIPEIAQLLNDERLKLKQWNSTLSSQIDVFENRKRLFLNEREDIKSGAHCCRKPTGTSQRGVARP